MTITREHKSVAMKAVDDVKVNSEVEPPRTMNSAPIFVALKRNLPKEPCEPEELESSKYNDRECPPVKSLLATLERREDERRRMAVANRGKDGILAESIPHMVYTHPVSITETTTSSDYSLDRTIDECLLGKEKQGVDRLIATFLTHFLRLFCFV